MDFATEYANAADDGAPYAGPRLIADSWTDAEILIAWVRGPNGEALQLVGEIVKTIPAERIGDTYSIIRKREGEQ